jgi:Hemerythrin HHE cation binding domain
MTDNETTQPHRSARPVLLPGQMAAPEGPLDMTMMYVMHHAFRRDMRDLSAAAAATPLADRATWRALQERWGLFAYALHHHHSGEDAGYWPLLLERVDDAHRGTLAAMEAEHAAIDPLLRAAAACFDHLATCGSPEARDGLVTLLREASAHLDAHLAHEETDAIPLLHRHITVAEDERIEVEHFRGPVPLRKVLALVPWAMHELPGDVRDRVFSTVGPAYRILWLLTRRGFARRHAAAMRYL